MTTLEIVLIIIIIYLIIVQIMNYISVACGCYLIDFEDLTCNIFWIIFLPIAIIRRIFYHN